MARHIWLTIAATLDFAAAILHLAIIAGGAEWYRFFGAGEDFASGAANGDIIPDLVTLGIAAILTTWGLYCLQAAGRVHLGLPWPRAVLTAITVIYAGRATAPLIAWAVDPAAIDNFLIWSSLVCTIYALAHGMGLRYRPCPD
jgi:hypothetical protein